ncbi:MAG: hypothetical protein IH948_06350, partial [Bacteroidetes bacterium]|nr:hypothetical protein [Bacteroidota bacterium]
LKSDTLFNKVNTDVLREDDTLFFEEVQEGLGYYYYVASVDEAGNESASNTIFVEVEDMIAPSMPTGVVTESDTGKIKITWDANIEKDLKGYRIYRTINKDQRSNFVLITPEVLTETKYTDELPKNAKNFFLYKIAAVDTSYNMSELSEAVKLKMPDVTPPAKPFIKNIVQQERKLIIQWIPNVEPDLLGYQLFKRSTISEEWEQENISLIPPTSSQYTDRDIVDGVLYEYRIVAKDSTENLSAKSNLFPFKVAFAGQKNELAPALSLKYTRRKNKVQLVWKHEQIDKSELKGYVVFRKPKERRYEKLTPLMKERLYNDKGIKKGDYSYQVRIYLNSGEVIRTDDATVAIK